MSQQYEGWSVDARPAVKGLALFVALLLLLVVGAALIYNHHYAAQTRAEPKHFPAPELETIDSAPHDRDPVGPTTPPPGIDNTMAATAAQGDALWND